jgi:hypothetical protein
MAAVGGPGVVKAAGRGAPRGPGDAPSHGWHLQPGVAQKRRSDKIYQNLCKPSQKGEEPGLEWRLCHEHVKDERPLTSCFLAMKQ